LRGGIEIFFYSQWVPGKKKPPEAFLLLAVKLFKFMERLIRNLR